MKDRQLKVFRLYFLIGASFAFVSLFMDWYILQATDNTGAILVDWNYHLFFDWYSPSKLETELNKWYRPKNASVPILLILFFIGILVIATFGVLFYSPDKFNKIKNPKAFGFINIALEFLLVYFIVIFPILYLFPNQLLFPVLVVYEYEIEITFMFSVGLGYWLQFIAFTGCFPYSYLYYKIVQTFELEQKVNETTVIPQSVNLDKLIAEAEFALDQNSQDLPNIDTETKLHDEPIPESLKTEAIYQAYMKKYHKEGKSA